MPRDPDLLQTEMTSDSYCPDLIHPDWQQALEALPGPERRWLQNRIGQAITGHPTPDGVMPVLQGGGENGKSLLLTDGLVPALGDYAAVASPKLFKSGRAEHSTERAELRGQRLVVAEELTEGRSIDIVALKQIQDVGQTTARKVYRDNLTFRASHSLFTTTNYTPVVAETDHGTWRRLALLRLPYTFRKPGQPLSGPLNRYGDPGLKRRIAAGADGQQDAAVTWAVEGAMRWYADPTTNWCQLGPLPPTLWLGGPKPTASWRTGTSGSSLTGGHASLPLRYSTTSTAGSTATAIPGGRRSCSDHA
jgi:phage/plasmid-associated DNA primase